MKNQMLSAVSSSPTLKAELARLFEQFPFEEMNPEFSRENDCVGWCDTAANIYIMPQNCASTLLCIYLHEVAHASLWHAGNKRWDKHGGEFILIARELQGRFGVADIAMNAMQRYDQQDALFKISPDDARRFARSAAREDSYCPLERAQELTPSSRPTAARSVQPPPPRCSGEKETALERLRRVMPRTAHTECVMKCSEAWGRFKAAKK